ncbi:hypothetical protein D3C78_1909420 [compost metagenome]
MTPCLAASWAATSSTGTKAAVVPSFSGLSLAAWATPSAEVAMAARVSDLSHLATAWEREVALDIYDS